MFHGTPPMADWLTPPEPLAVSQPPSDPDGATGGDIEIPSEATSPDEIVGPLISMGTPMEMTESRRPRRARNLPVRFRDYVM